MDVDQFLLNRIRVATEAASGGANSMAIAEARRRQLPYWRCDVASLAERMRAPPANLCNWADYVATILIGSGLCCAGAIVDLTDLALLASANTPLSSPADCERPQPSKDDLAELLSAIRRRGRQSQVTLCGREWRVDLADGHTGIKCSGGEIGSPEGLTAARSRSKLIIGWHSERQDPSLCNLVVCNLADFFSSKDF